MLKRAMMAGLNAPGVNVLDLEVALGAGHPVPHPPAACACGGLHRCGWSTATPQSVVIRFFDTDGPRPGRGRPAQDRAAVQPGGRAPGVPRRDRRHRVPAPGAWRCTPPPSKRRSTPRPSATARLKVVVDYGYGSTSFVMPNVLAKMGADVLGVNPYATTGRGHGATTPTSHAANVAALVGASAPSLGAVIDPDGEHLTLIDDSGRVLTHTQALLALLALVAEPPASATRSPCPVDRARPRRGDRRPAPAVSGAVDQAVHAGPDGRRHRARRRLRRQRSTAATSSRASCRPSTAPPSLVKVLELLARTGRGSPRWSTPTPTPHLAKETVVTPWEQKGTVMRALVEMSEGPRGSSWSTG